MRVMLQYADHTEWEGPPEDAHQSPDPRPPPDGSVRVYKPGDEYGGVIRMWAYDDEGRELRCTYEDLYYLYRNDSGPGWWFGAGTPKQEFLIQPGVPGTVARGVKFEVPKEAVVRYGVTVTDEEALAFGLVDPADPKQLHHKILIPVEYV